MNADAQAGGRSERWLAAAAAVLAAGLVGVGVCNPRHASAPPAMCPDPAAGLDSVLETSTPGRIEAALVATGAPYARASATTIAFALTEYVRAWQAFAQRSCAGAEPRDAAVDRCLHQRRSELVATIDALETLDATSAPWAVAAVAALRPPSDCVAGPRRAGADDPELNATLAALRVASALRRDESVVQICAPLLAATAGQSTAVTGSVHLAMGHGALRTGRAAAAESAFERAVWSAVASDDPVTLFEAAVELTGPQFAGRAASDPRTPRRWLKLAAAAAARLGSRPADEAVLAERSAAHQSALGDHAGALTQLDEAIRRLEPTGQTTALLPLLTAAAEAALRGGQAMTANTLHRRAVATATATHGLGHPTVFDVRIHHVESLIAIGERDLARETLERGQAELGAEPASIERFLRAGTLALGLSGPGPARTSFESAAALIDRLGLSAPDPRAEATRGIALAHSADGDFVAAITLLDRTANTLRALEPARPRLLASILIDLQEAQISAARIDEARTTGARAVRELESLPEPPLALIAQLLLGSASAALIAGELQAALDLAEQAFSVADSGDDATGELRFAALQQTGAALLGLGRDADAASTFTSAVGLAQTRALDLAATESARLGLATALWQAGDRKSAEATARVALVALSGHATDGAASSDDARAWFERRGLTP